LLCEDPRRETTQQDLRRGPRRLRQHKRLGFPRAPRRRPPGRGRRASLGPVHGHVTLHASAPSARDFQALRQVQRLHRAPIRDPLNALFASSSSCSVTQGVISWLALVVARLAPEAPARLIRQPISRKCFKLNAFDGWKRSNEGIMFQRMENEQ
jgi:hypothetical protein